MIITIAIFNLRDMPYTPLDIINRRGQGLPLSEISHPTRFRTGAVGKRTGAEQGTYGSFLSLRYKNLFS